MNIRRNIDYTDMYAALDSAMEQNLSQVELYYEIGRAVCQRTEKGAAVAAAAYLRDHYPDIQGFSPRNLRRMRDFYRVYENHPALQAVAMQVCWTQNVVILEADLSVELRGWYLMAASQFGWSKAELMEKITTNAHEMIILTNMTSFPLGLDMKKGAHCWTPSSYSVIPDYVANWKKRWCIILFVLHNGADFKM